MLVQPCPLDNGGDWRHLSGYVHGRIDFRFMGGVSIEGLALVCSRQKWPDMAEILLVWSFDRAGKKEREDEGLK